MWHRDVWWGSSWLKVSTNFCESQYSEKALASRRRSCYTLSWESWEYAVLCCCTNEKQNAVQALIVGCTWWGVPSLGFSLQFLCFLTSFHYCRDLLFIFWSAKFLWHLYWCGSWRAQWSGPGGCHGHDGSFMSDLTYLMAVWHIWQINLGFLQISLGLNVKNCANSCI